MSLLMQSDWATTYLWDSTWRYLLTFLWKGREHDQEIIIKKRNPHKRVAFLHRREYSHKNSCFSNKKLPCLNMNIISLLRIFQEKKRKISVFVVGEEWGDESLQLHVLGLVLWEIWHAALGRGVSVLLLLQRLLCCIFLDVFFDFLLVFLWSVQVHGRCVSV